MCELKSLHVSYGIVFSELISIFERPIPEINAAVIVIFVIYLGSCSSQWCVWMPPEYGGLTSGFGKRRFGPHSYTVLGEEFLEMRYKCKSVFKNSEMPVC